MAQKFLNGIDLQNQRAVLLADPSAATDAATKQYVDNLVNGLNWKDEVVAATTTTGTLATAYAAGQVIDGYTLVTGDRILIKDQATGAENGIYVVASSGAPTRAADASTAANLKSATVFVQRGTVNADRAYTMTTDSVTLGTTALTWSQFGGTSSYTAGNGLSLTGSQFAAVAATNGGIAVAAGGISALLVTNGGLQSGAPGLSVVTGTGVTLTGGAISIDTTVVTRKYAVNVPSGSTSATITHSLGTTDVIVQVYEISGGALVQPDVVATSTTVVTLTFATAPTTGQYRCVVQG